MTQLYTRLVRGTAVLAAASFIYVSSASAMTIYDEGVTGDLDNIGSTIVALGLGDNDILGSLPGTPPPDTDRIRFSQAGFIVNSIILSFTSAFDPGNNGQSLNSALFNDTANLFDDNFGNINSGAAISAAFFDSFGAETGPISQTTDTAIWDFQLSAGLVSPFQDWQLRINTSAAPTGPGPNVVPLPAALPLFAGGLGLMGLMGWRRKQSAAA